MKKLGDLLEFKNGINASKEQYGKGIKFVNVSDILNNDFLTYENIAGLVDIDSLTLSKYSVEYGDILFQRSSETRDEVGTANVYLDKDNTAAFGGFVIRGKKQGDYNPIFLNNLLKSATARNSITSRSGGSTRYNVGQEILSSVKLCFPTIAEQEKIGKLLSLIDNRIQTQNKIIKKLESLIRGLNNYLHKKYGNDVEISLAKLGKSYNGLSGKSGDDFGMGKPYITYVNVYQNSTVDESMIGYVKISDGEKQNTIRYGDALFTISSETSEEVGISSVYLGENQELYLNSFCFGYRLDDFNILNPKYMPYCFSSYKFRKFVYPLAQGSTRFNLHMHHFMNKKFKIPTAQNQLRIRKLLDSISEKLQTEKFIYSSLREQKSYLLKKLFI